MPVNYDGAYSTPRLDLQDALEEYQLDLAAQGFVAELIAPTLPVMRKAASYSAITREQILQTPDTKRAKGAAYNRVTFGAVDKDYKCQNNGIEIPVEDSDREELSQDFDAEVIAAQIGELIVRRNFEIRIKDLLFNTTTWTGSALFTDNSAAPWDAAGSDIIGQVRDAKRKVRENSGLTADTLLVGALTWDNMLANTGILGRFPGIDALTEDVLAANVNRVLGLPRVVVGGGVQNTANEGQAAVIADIWGDDYAMVCVSARPGQDLTVPAVARTMLWQPMGPRTVNLESYREEQTESEIIRNKQWTDEVVPDAFFGHLMQVDA